MKMPLAFTPPHDGGGRGGGDFHPSLCPIWAWGLARYQKSGVGAASAAQLPCASRLKVHLQEPAPGSGSGRGFAGKTEEVKYLSLQPKPETVNITVKTVAPIY